MAEESDSAEGRAQAVDLTKASLAQLLVALLRRRFTGVLRLPPLTSQSGVSTVSLRSGLPVFSDLNYPADLFGEILVAAGRIDATVRDAALAATLTQKIPIGQALIDAGAMSPDQVGDTLRIQCTRRLSRLFSLRSGLVTIEPGKPVATPGDQMRGQVNVLNLVLHGTCAHYDSERVSLEMGPNLAGHLKTTPAFDKYRQHLSFRDQDEALIALLRQGARSVELANSLVVPNRRLAIVLALWRCGLLECQSPQSSVQTPTPTPAAPKATPSPTAPTPTRAKSPQSTASAPPKAAPTQASTTLPKSTPARVAPRSTRSPEPTPDPTKQRAANLSPKAEAFVQALTQMEQRIASEPNAFELFGIDLEAGRKQVRGAWAQLSKEYHPDRLAGLELEHLKERTEAVFSALSEAYATLSNKSSREKLRSVIAAGGKAGLGSAEQEAAKLIKNAFEAEHLARDADKLLSKGNFKKAEPLLIRSLSLDGGQSQVKAALIWCNYNVGPRSAEDGNSALAHLDALLKDHPKCARTHYYAGLIGLKLEDFDRARTHLKATLKAEPKNLAAARQLRALDGKAKQASTAKAQESEPPKRGLKGMFGRRS